MQSLLPGSGYQKQLLAAQGQLQSSTAQLQIELLQSQTKLSELEAQVRAAGQPGPLHSSWEVVRSITRRQQGLDAQAWGLVAKHLVPLIHPCLGAQVGAGAGPAQDAAGEFAAAAPGRPGAH